MAFCALALFPEQGQAFFRVVRERLLVALEIPVEQSVPGNERPFEGGDRHGHALTRDLAAEYLLERIYILRYRSDHFLDKVEISVHFERGHHREERLFFEALCSSVMKQVLLERYVH